MHGLCLFLAIGLTIKYVKIQGTENKSIRQCYGHQFNRLLYDSNVENKNRRKDVALSLLNDIKKCGIKIIEGINGAYSIEEHVPLIQQYLYSLENPEDRCRLIIFGPYGMQKPMFKGQMKARWDIPLFYHDGHFKGIRKLK